MSSRSLCFAKFTLLLGLFTFLTLPNLAEAQFGFPAPGGNFGPSPNFGPPPGGLGIPQQPPSWPSPGRDTLPPRRNIPDDIYIEPDRYNTPWPPDIDPRDRDSDPCDLWQRRGGNLSPYNEPNPCEPHIDPYPPGTFEDAPQPPGIYDDPHYPGIDFYPPEYFESDKFYPKEIPDFVKENLERGLVASYIYCEIHFYDELLINYTPFTGWGETELEATRDAIHQCQDSSSTDISCELPMREFCGSYKKF